MAQAIGQVVDGGDLAALHAGEVAVDEPDQVDTGAAAGGEHVLGVHAQPTIAATTAVIDLSAVPVVDNHVHPWRVSTRAVSVDDLAGSVAFSDGVVASVRREFLPGSASSRR